MTASPGAAHPPSGDAIISNGTVQLGVHNLGHLNVPGGTPSSGSGTTDVGLRFVPTGAEATAPGCLCEGWGAADAISGVTGYANEAIGTSNVTPVSFSSDADSAVSVVDVGSTLRVTHDYQPSATPQLYTVKVSIQNISAAAVDLRYRRVMDWDVEPTAFDEFVTIQGTAGATEVAFASNNGFASADPLEGPSSIGGLTGDFVDAGPFDHGALFDFNFGILAAGGVKTFTTFYGAAATEAGALSALAAVNAEVYSFGQPSTPDGPTLGTPNTFIFAFAGVGGTALNACALPSPLPAGTIHAVPSQITYGTSGDDVIVGTSGDDRITGLGGNDKIYGQGGNDKLSGGDGNDLLCGDEGNDELLGGNGDDKLHGNEGNDDLAGGPGGDDLSGGPGDDRLSGGLGNDVCTGGGDPGDLSAASCETVNP